MDTFFPKSSKHLTKEKNGEAFESLIFLKVKMDGRVKGRTFVNFRKKLKKLVPGDATSPTVSIDSILVMATVYAHERRDIRICNILGDFISADMDEGVKMTMCGRLEKIMVKIAPQIYRHHVKYKKGSMVLYVTLKKALCGCLR